MPNNSGQGSISFGSRTVTPAAPTVTAANEGLSLSGTTVQLGNANILSGLPQITVDRYIPITAGAAIQLNSSNIAAPLNFNRQTPALIQLRKDVLGGSTPTINVQDGPTASAALVFPAVIQLGGNAALGTTPRLSIIDGGNVAQNSQTNITISLVNNALSNVITASNCLITSAGNLSQSTSSVFNIFRSLVGGTIPAITLQDTFAGNSLSMSPQVITLIDATTTSPRFVFGTGTVAQQLEWRNTVGNMQLLDNVGVNIFSFNKTVANTSIATIGQVGSRKANLLFPGNTSGVITMQPQAVAGTYNFNLPITAGGVGDILTSGGGGAAAMTFTAPAALTGLPYISINGSTALAGSVTVDGTASGFSCSIDTPGLITLGDSSLRANGTALSIDDTTGVCKITSSIAAQGSFQTDRGVTANAGAWTLGNIVIAAAVLNATRYVEIAINGTLVKLAVII